MWYRTGTIAVTNGSTAVTGTGTAWIANAAIGEALLAPDGKMYEISNIAADGAMTLGSPYLGATQSGQGYVIVPSQSYIRDLAAQAAALVNNYAALVNTVGQGKFADGTVGAPGISFVGDQDTGLHRSASGEVELVSNGTVVAKWGSGGFENLGAQTNNIGIPGQQGFGLGICPGPLPAGMSEMDGTRNITSDNYGNYLFSDGSVMVWMPAFFYKWGSGVNGLALNACDVKPRTAYESVALANASGYALHRAFYDGFEQPGVFVDKYLGTNNGGIFSSLKNGIPCDTDNSQTDYGINQLAGAPALNYGGMQAACKSRGSNFHGTSIFIYKALAMLSYVHAAASANATYCAWYSESGTNYPKGCNNNALGDVNDASLAFVSAGHTTYSAKSKTGSANFFARTTHNGQNSGIADLSGTMWEAAFGLTSDGADYYLLKTTKRLRDLTGSAGAATDLFGAPGIAANYDSIGATYGSLTVSNSQKLYGAATQVFDAATSGTAWQATGAGIPIATGGTNAFGNDGLWDYRPAEMCPIVGAAWGDGAAAGVWALYLTNVRANANNSVGGRAALYL